ncbi:hypothetical protein A3J41_03160 [candidate division TM6 bacterium RIFCSPHIGHO2_12_FULL_38_8]|nr:MAG: hypothetical protein A3J41_03160 [candidate division TM6 bacterium RIFCSPHIGHO2_12_FULL_38_8]
MNHKQSFAEIIQGSLSSWTGQCWQWDHMPQFGSLVITSHADLRIFGIVHTITTGSQDPIRSVTPYQKTEEELLRDQPQIFEFLQTTFTCITVGYQEANQIFYHLPEKPPKIHAFVSNPSAPEYQLFFQSDQFLHLLFNVAQQGINLDELLLALLKQLHAKKILDKTKFYDFIETFSMLYKHDYQRLRIFLKRTNHVFGLDPQPVRHSH